MITTTPDLREMYDALAGLLKASILYRVGGATLESLTSAEARAVSALRERHEEYVESGDSTVPEVAYPSHGFTQDVTAQRFATAITVRDAPIRRKQLKDKQRDPLKAARNAEIRQKMTALFSDGSKSAAYRALAKEYNVSLTTIQHIVERRGGYAHD